MTIIVKSIEELATMDWKSRCFEAAFAALMDRKEWTLVHGLVKLTSGRICPRAWIEDDTTVIDLAQSDYEWTRDEYYDEMVEAIKRYTLEEALEHFELHNGSRKVGPWDDNLFAMMRRV